jgi:hypothetical protein
LYAITRVSTSVPGGNGIVVGKGPGGLSKYTDGEGVVHPVRAEAVAVALGVPMGATAVAVG